MKKQFLHVMGAILLITAGCSQESFVNEQKVDEQVSDGKPTFITLTAGMPDEGLQTRISLERDNLDIKLTWEEGDQLQLCLKYGDVFAKQVTTVTDISPDGKTAKFPVELPPGDYETFDLYGVYGGGGLDDEDPTKAILPTSAASTSGSLETLKTNKTVMLTFAQTGIPRTNPTFPVNLSHMGSLFCIQLRNMSSTPWDNIRKVQLTAANPIYAHNNTGLAAYDLITGTFSGTTSENILTFELSSATDLAANTGFQEFWGWYPPVAGQNWPEMKLKVIDGSDQELAESINSKPARTAPTPAGKAFYFSATYDGSQLEFINTAALTDIDGNVYTTVVIGDLEWMAENLRVTHYRNGDPITTDLSNTGWSSATSGAYAVYPYTNTSGAVASEEEMRAKYGLLYNGYAVTDARGLAPEGWRIATDDDYKNLEMFAGMTQQEVNLTGWRGSVGLKLKSETWPTYPGTDDFGFRALPAGNRDNVGNFQNFNSRTMFWTETEDGSTRLWRRMFENTDVNYNKIWRSTQTDVYGYSLRCVRDR